MIRMLLILMHLAFGLTAVAIGGRLIKDPSGEVYDLSTEQLKPWPFQDFKAPALFLAIAVGGTNFLSALLQLRRSRAAAASSLGTGLLLLGWLAFQSSIVGFQKSAGWTMFTGVATALAALQMRRRPAPPAPAQDAA